MAFPSKYMAHLFIVFAFLPSLVGGILYFKDENHARIALYLQLCSCAHSITSLYFAYCATERPVFLLPLFIVICISFLFIGLLVDDYKEEHRVRIRVQDVRLSEFTLNSTSVTYNLAMSIVVGPNGQNRAVHFTAFRVRISYQDQTFVSSSLPPFTLGGMKNSSVNASTVVLRQAFQGHRNVFVSPTMLKTCQLDKDADRFTFNVIVRFSGFRTMGYGFKGKELLRLGEIPGPNATGEWVHEDTEGYNIYKGWAVFFVIFSVCKLIMLWRSIKKAEWIWIVRKNVVIVYCGLIPAVIFCVLWTYAVAKEGNRSIWHVSNATLSNFDYSPNGTLNYNLSLVVRIGPNTKKTGLYMEKLEVELDYLDQKFASFFLPSSYLEPKHSDGARTLIFRRGVKGRAGIVLSGEELGIYKKNREAKRFQIAIKISLEGSRTNNYDSSGETRDYGRREVKNDVLHLKVPLL